MVEAGWSTSGCDFRASLDSTTPSISSLFSYGDLANLPAFCNHHAHKAEALLPLSLVLGADWPEKLCAGIGIKFTIILSLCPPVHGWEWDAGACAWVVGRSTPPHDCPMAAK